MPNISQPWQVLSDGEQAIIDEVLAREWLRESQLDQILRQRAGATDKPALPDLLLEQKLISRKQAEELGEFLHKELEFDDFAVERKLGSGAMGDVFLAVRNSTGERAALKVISRKFADDEQFVKRFTRESQAMVQLIHPNIARAIAHGVYADRHYLALEYVPGPSLAKLVFKHGVLDQQYALCMLAQVAAGLDYVYTASGLVHRDVKPENILTAAPESEPALELGRQDTREVAKLIDFGLARSFQTDERLTMTGITMGTPHYMSPEQIRGAQDLDCRSDIYALGATLYHLLTGKTPYEGTSPGAVMTAHLTRPPPDPRERVPALHAKTVDIVITAMAKDPAERFANYHAFTSACAQALEALTRDSNDMPRLLRKPLVIDNPVSTGRARKARQPSPARGHRQRPTTEYRATDDPSASAAQSVPEDATPAEALCQLQSRHAAARPLERRAASDKAAPNVGGQRRESITTLLNRAGNPGTGVMPWVVLLLAVAVLTTIILLRL